MSTAINKMHAVTKGAIVFDKDRHSYTVRHTLRHIGLSKGINSGARLITSLNRLIIIMQTKNPGEFRFAVFATNPTPTRFENLGENEGVHHQHEQRG